MTTSNAHRDHVTPHHAWAYFHIDRELTTGEHDHVLDCEDCLQLFRLCVKSETFGAFLKKVGVSSDERRLA